MITRARERIGTLGSNPGVRGELVSGLEAVLHLLLDADADRPSDARRRVLPPLALTVLGNTLKEVGVPERASAAYTAAVRRFEAAGVPLDRPAERIAYARALYETGSLGPAIEMLKEVAEAEGYPPAVVLPLSDWLRAEGRLREAERFLTRGLVRHPDEPSLLRAAADVGVALRSPTAATSLERLAALLTGRAGQAEVLERYRAASAALPDDAEVVRGYALALLRAGRADEALAALDAGMVRVKDRTLLLLAKSGALLAEQRPHEALRQLEQLQGDEQTQAQVLGLTGLALAATGRHEDAAARLREALDTDPSQDHLYAALADVHMQLGQPGDALATVELGLLRETESQPLLLLRCRALMAQGQLDQAVEALRDGRLQDSAEGHALLAEALDLLDRPGEALVEANRALALQANLSTALVTRARLLEREGRLEEALASLSRVELVPEPPWLVLERARLLTGLGQSSAATRLLDHVLDGPQSESLPPEHRGAAHGTRARVRADGGDLSGAEADLRAALASAPDDPALLLQLGEVLERQRRSAEALALVDRALDLAPLAETWARGGEVLARLGEGQRAKESFERALALQPADPHTRLLLAELLLSEHGHEQEALSLLEATTFDRSTRLRAHRAAGKALFRLGRYEDAYETLDRVLAMQPDDLETQRLLAHTLLGLDRPESALRLLQAAVETAPDEAELWCDLAYAYNQVKDDDEALPAARRAAELKPHDLAVLRLLAALLLGAGEYEEAIGLLTPLVDDASDPDADDLGMLAWAMENCGEPQLLDTARDLYQRAVEASRGDSPWYRRGLGNVLRALREPGADDQFRAVLSILERRAAADAVTLALAGWCHYALREYEHAIDRYLDALRLDPDDLAVTFDLALAALCQGNAEPARLEYQRTVDRAEALPAVRRRGLLRVALVDLDQAESVLSLDADAVGPCRAPVQAALSALEAPPDEPPLVPPQPTRPNVRVGGSPSG